MNQFTESHLKSWKNDYLRLINNQKYKLLEDNVLTEEEFKKFSAPIGTRTTYEEYNAEIHTKN